MKNFILTFGFFLMLSSCEKPSDETSLNDFCKIAPDGWECEIIEENFDLSDIPMNSDEPLAIVKYQYPLEEITTIGESLISPSLILNIYPIALKSNLIEHVNSQAIFSWCIPRLYGETSNYMIITSPCFINNGTLTEEANGKIEALHTALEKILVKSYYNHD